MNQNPVSYVYLLLLVSCDLTLYQADDTVHRNPCYLYLLEVANTIYIELIAALELHLASWLLKELYEVLDEQ